MFDLLIATLGSANALCTGLECMARSGLSYDQIVVIHTASRERYGSALGALSWETVRERLDVPNHPAARILKNWRSAAHPPLTFAPITLANGTLVEDVDTEQIAHATMHAIGAQITLAKRAGHRVDLNPNGGRKSMSMIAMNVAAAWFGDNDRILMHVQQPGLATELAWLDASKTMAEQLKLVMFPTFGMAASRPELSGELRLVSAFVRKLESSTVLPPLARLLATQGLTDKEMAATLAWEGGRPVSVEKVKSRMKDLYERANEHFGAGASSINRTSLASRLAPYYALHAYDIAT